MSKIARFFRGLFKTSETDKLRDKILNEEIDFGNVDTSKVENMGGMFYKCSTLTTLDLSNFNTSNVGNMFGMFYDCQSLKRLQVHMERHQFRPFYDGISSRGLCL